MDRSISKSEGYVYFNKQRKKWNVRISINKKPVSLGRFDNKEDAIKARLKAEMKYYGEFAPQADLFEQYGIKNEI